MLNSILFQQSLQDLVKGIRSHRRDEAQFIRQKGVEIANECRSKDIATKANAILKLTHLQMMGYSMSFASFHVVEVICSPDFATKRVGYLAAAQSFSPTTDVLLLTTNQFKKDLTNGKMQDCSQALTCLGKLATESLAVDLSADVAMLLSSPRPYIRKKTLLVLFRFIAVYPQTLGVISEKFRKCLEDPDPGVVCAAVTVTCELARKSPPDFLGLAPALYALLTSSSNNWMLIKIVKLMGVLTPLEPRLGKKLVGPLTKLMRNTRAKSLLYECCSTVTLGLMEFPEAVQLCAERLSEFIVDPDQNLKYLGLLSLRRLAAAHPSVAMQHRDLILDCLDDVDIGIRMRALELVSEFVTQRTFRDITRILLRKLEAVNECASTVLTTVGEAGSSAEQVAAETDSSSALILDPETPFRDALARQLLVAGEFVAGEGYPLLSSGDDFAWYSRVVLGGLGGLARLPRVSKQVCETVAFQLTELMSRVEAVRPATLAVAVALLSDARSDVADTNTDGEALSESQPASGVSGTELSLMDTEFELAAETATNEMAADPAAVPDEAAPVVPPSTFLPVTSKRKHDATRVSSAVVASAAWVVGEYSDLLKDPAATTTMLISYPVKELSSVAQVALLMAIVKVYCSCDTRHAQALCGSVMSRLSDSTFSGFAEVSDRSILLRGLMELTDGGKEMEILASIFEGELVPVDASAQATALVPEGLDLDAPLLDTGSVDLHTFLTGSSTSFDAPSRGFDIEDKDDLFAELENGDGQFGGKGRSTSASAVTNVTRSPFLLQAENDQLPTEDVTRSSQALTADAEFGVNPGDTTPVSVFTGNVGGNSSKGGAEKGSRKSAKKNGLASTTNGGSDSIYGGAFQGLFDVPVQSHPDGQSRQLDGTKRKKSKSKKKKKKVAESGMMPETGINSSNGGTPDLIDFGDVNADASTEASSAAKPTNSKQSAPAHIGDMDLLS